MSRAVVPFDPVAAGRELTKSVNDRRDQWAALLGVELESDRGKAIVDRFVTVALHAATSRPDLLRATRESLVESIRDAAMLGLEPVGATGDGTIVVYSENVAPKGSTPVYQDVAHFQPMYRGLLKLARRSDKVASIAAHVVYEADRIEIELGADADVRHWPALVGRGKPLGAYAIAVLNNGRKVPDWMEVAEIEQVRKSSRAKDRGPWVDFWPEMARKTVLRRLMKALPLETLAEHAMRIESEAEAAAALPALVESTAAPSEARARLRARLIPAETAIDGPGASEEAQTGEETAQPPTEARRVGPGPETKVCGSASDDKLGPSEVCELEEGHDGAHKAVNQQTGEVTRSWPK